LNSYKEYDNFFISNADDSYLKPIKIILPEPPDWEYIEGFGLKAEDQIFKKEIYPNKLILLEKSVSRKEKENTASNRILTKQKVLTAIWEELEKNSEKYRDELLFIKRQWYYRLYGKWVFINGKPTYIDGWHWFYINYWDMRDVKRPEYRDADRTNFLFHKYALTCTQTDKGEELGYRVCFGVVNPKHRRKGATNMALCRQYCFITENIGFDGGIQSYNNDNAETHYKTKLLNAFDEMAFFFKPQWLGSTQPQNGLIFRSSNTITNEYNINGKIDFATSASRSFYNGKKLYYLLLDEEGRESQEDILARWQVLKLTLSTGAASNIHGFSEHPSSVEEFDLKGVESYYALCEGSDFYNRNDLGQTSSGLFVFFQKAYEGLEGFIGKYGESIIETPTEEQIKYTRKKIGAKEYIDKTLSHLLKNKNHTEYQKFMLEHPTQYVQCFQNTNREVNFDVGEMTKAFERLSRGEEKNIKGNFLWVVPNLNNPLTSKEFLKININNQYDSIASVVFNPDDNGRWILSEVLPVIKTNQKFNRNGIWYLSNQDRYITGTDSYKFIPTTQMKYKKEWEKTRLSKGATTTFKLRDFTIDPTEKDITQWLTHRFVCTYENRPDDDDEFCEDALMQCVYYGSWLYPEYNIATLIKHFERRGYAGYFKYGLDPMTNKMKTVPGVYSAEASKQDLFKAFQKYVLYHFNRERHIEIVTQAQSISGIDKMTDFDLLTACMITLHGVDECNNMIVKTQFKTNKKYSILDIYG
jgi:hypothetical protein